MEQSLPVPQAKQTRKRGTLREKFTLAFLGVSVIPLLAMGAIAVYLVNASSRQSISQLELQLVRQKKEEVERFFEEITGVFDLRLSRDAAQHVGEQGSITIYDISVIPSMQRRFLLEGVLSESKAIESASFFTLEGKEIERVERARQIIPEHEFIDASQLEKFTKPRAGESYLSPIRYTLEGARMTVASPVRNAAHDVIGVLAGDILLKPVERIIARGVLGNAGYLLLVGDSKELIAASLKDASSHPSLGAVKLVTSVVGGVTRTGQENEDRYASFWGEQVIGAGVHLANLPLAIVAEWPQADAFDLTRTLSNQALTFSLFTLLAVFLISVLIARKITKPIDILRREVRFIGEGKFDEMIDVKTNDELEDLDIALHEMAGAIKTIQQLRDEFVFIAAHELRAPVTAIKGYISMLLEEGGTLTKEAKDMLTQVQKANQHLVQLVQDLLEVARSEAGRMQVEVAPQNIVEATEAVVRDLMPLWQEHKLTVDHKLPPEGFPLALADADKLREVLVNLVSNATKYNRDSGTITIWHEADEHAVVTHVQDTGIGMASEEVAKLFGKFYRAENADTRKVQGTGLGLFIVKQIVEKMNGKIFVESERGKGSVFSFSLPVAP